MSDITDLTSIAPELITASPRLRALIEERLAEIIDATFDHLLDALEAGDAATVSTLTKQLLPTFLRIQKEHEGVETADAEAILTEARAFIAAAGKSLAPEPDPIFISEETHEPVDL